MSKEPGQISSTMFHIRFTDTSGEGQEIRVTNCCDDPDLSIGFIMNSQTEKPDPTIQCDNCDSHLLFVDFVPWESKRR
jgi:hypothetical protein